MPKNEKTIGNLRNVIKKENLSWLPDKNLKDTDPLPVFPTGGMPEDPSVLLPVVNIDEILKGYNPTNPFLTENKKI